MKKLCILSSVVLTLLVVSGCSHYLNGDSTSNENDLCPTDPNKTEPGQCGCNVQEGTCPSIQDSDGDGTPDEVDQCPSDPNKVEPGQCGCNINESSCTNNPDSDGDGTDDQQDLCPHDPDKIQPGDCGCGVAEGSCSQDDPGGVITHVGTTQVYDSDGQHLTIDRPSDSQAGDLLVLFLHRTDDDLPLSVAEWTRVAECYKQNNEYDCSTHGDCVGWHNDDFCDDFGGHGGHDLAQAAFIRTMGAHEPNSYQFDLNIDSSGHPAWAILTALRGAATSNPVRDWAYKGCDGNPDSVFPSVYGENGDMVLLSQSFDDAVAQSKFQAPVGTATYGYVSQSDEAGFLFGGILETTGETGTMKTQGEGASDCKDALVSLTIQPK